jgi:pimeloyl-ACP methyl ester carboxylesterase
MKFIIAPEQPPACDTGIVLPNHLGGDTLDSMGDRADVLSSNLNMPVLVYVRPGTGRLPAMSKIRNTNEYLESVKSRAVEVNRRFSEYGVDKYIIVGNSSGGTEAIALAASGILNVTQLIVMEPVAMREVEPIEGLRYFKSQQDDTREELYDPEFDALPNIPPIREQISIVVTGKRATKEVWAYNRVFSSDLSQRLLQELVTEHPEIPIDLFLGARSLATTEDLRADMIKRYQGSSLNLEVFPGGQHSFAMKLHFFLHIIKRAMKRVECLPPTAVE